MGSCHTATRYSYCIYAGLDEGRKDDWSSRYHGKSDTRRKNQRAESAKEIPMVDLLD